MNHEPDPRFACGIDRVKLSLALLAGIAVALLIVRFAHAGPAHHALGRLPTTKWSTGESCRQPIAAFVDQAELCFTTRLPGGSPIWAATSGHLTVKRKKIGARTSESVS